MAPPGGRAAGRQRAPTAFLVLLVLAAAWPAGSAFAVTGGAPADGALSRAGAMVLSSRGGVCSAVVVAPDAIMTAGHCVSGAPELRVHWRDGGEPVLVQPTAAAVHPGYVPGAVAGRRRSVDLALVRLPEPLPARFRPAVLGTAPPARGAAVVLGGFGVAREGDARSSGTWREAGLATIEPHGPSTLLLWLRDPAGRAAGACTGDSGGPVATEGGAVVAVVGYASGAGARGCGDVSQAILLGPQRSWIDRTLTGWGRRAEWR